MTVKTYGTIHARDAIITKKGIKDIYREVFFKGKKLFLDKQGGKVWLSDKKYLKLLLHTRACFLSSVAETKLFVLAPATA